MEKKCITKLALFQLSLIILISLASASDVAYIYKNNFAVDNNIIDVFNELGLKVDLVNDNDLELTDFSNFQLIFVGDELFKNTQYIPLEEKPTVFANYYHGYEFGLTDSDGISSLASNSPLNILKNNQVIPVYTQATYSLGSSAIPYYYLADINKLDHVESVARTYVGLHHSDFGDVVAYSSPQTLLLNGHKAKEKICFFGIIESDFWTPEARQLFKDCANFVAITCSKRNDCPEKSYSENYCLNNNVYRNKNDYYCQDPATINSKCIATQESELLETCQYGCENGQCYGECDNPSDCGTDFYSEKYCLNNNLYQNFTQFSCTDYQCSNSTSTNLLEECNYGCENSQCIEPICHSDSECGTNKFIGEKYCSMQNNVYQDFINFTCNLPGQLNSFCTNITTPKLIQECNYHCKDGECYGNCVTDNDCGQDYLSEKFCKNNNVYKTSHNFSCEQGYCDQESTDLLIQECDDLCLNGECVEIVCSNDNDCDDDDVYTVDKCNNPATPQSYCTNTKVNCVTDNDCGFTGFYGEEYCVLNSVFKPFQEAVCKNPATTNSYCDITKTQKQLKDCGEDYCETWQQNYCKNDDVYKKRTCFENSCCSGKCLSNTFIEEALVEECEYDCYLGKCINPQEPECSNNQDCGTAYSSQPFCNNSNLYKTSYEFLCLNNFCYQETNNILIQECEHGCSNAQCIDEPTECSNNQDCGTAYYSQPFCNNSNLYKTFHEFLCINNSCHQNLTNILIQECEFDCLNAKCTDKPTQCSTDQDCPGYITQEKICEGDDIINKITKPVCINNTCTTNITNEYIWTCSAGCIDGKCRSTSSSSSSRCTSCTDQIITIQTNKTFPKEDNSPLTLNNQESNNYDLQLRNDNTNQNNNQNQQNPLQLYLFIFLIIGIIGLIFLIIIVILR